MQSSQSQKPYDPSNKGESTVNSLANNLHSSLKLSTPLNEEEQSNQTQLQEALTNNDYEKIKGLMDKGVTCKDPMSFVPLGGLLLSSAGEPSYIQNFNTHQQLKLLEYLIKEKHADPNGFRSTEMISHMGHAAWSGNIQIVKNMLDNGGGLKEAFFGAIAGGQLEVVKLLVEEKGIDVNGKLELEGVDAPPLFWFGLIKRPNIDVVKYLVEKGADVNGDNDGLRLLDSLKFNLEENVNTDGLLANIIAYLESKGSQ